MIVADKNAAEMVTHNRIVERAELREYNSKVGSSSNACKVVQGPSLGFASVSFLQEARWSDKLR